MSPRPLEFAMTPEVTAGGATENTARIVPSSLIGTANRALRSGKSSALPSPVMETNIVCGVQVPLVDALTHVACTYPRIVDVIVEGTVEASPDAADESSATKPTKLPSALMEGE